MSDQLSQLNAFFARWRGPIEERALVRFEAGALPDEGLTPAAKVDAFAGQFGFKPIGFNWEMLDPSEDLTAPRSARGTIVEALTTDIADRTTPWLSFESALQCASEFIAPFEPSSLSLVTNHLNGLWWPISGAGDEWSFAVMDERAIALLVMVPRA